LPALILAGMIATLISCKKDEPSVFFTEKEIVSFMVSAETVPLLDTSNVSVSIREDSILIAVPYGTLLTKMAPEIKIKAKSISPASGTVLDFTNPVTFTVTAENGTTKTYTAVVTISKPKYIVYFGGYDKYFYAVDGKSGALIWKTLAGGGFSNSDPTVVGNTIYVGANDGKLYAFDTETGRIKWTSTAASEAIESSPAISTENNTVFFGSDDDSFYAVDASTGALKWKYRTGFNVSTNPLLVGNMVYVASDDRYLYAFDQVTGAIKWESNCGNWFVESSPVYANNTIYVGGRSGKLLAINIADGTRNWFIDLGTSLERSTPIIVNNVLYIGSEHGGVFAVDINTQTVLSNFLTSAVEITDPAIANDKLYATSGSNVYCTDLKTGNIVWSNNILPNYASPIVVDNIVYAGGGGMGYFYAFDPNTGGLKWKYAIPNLNSTTTPCIVDDKGQVFYKGTVRMR